jgi:hypothetical protein
LPWPHLVFALFCLPQLAELTQELTHLCTGTEIYFLTLKARAFLISGIPILDSPAIEAWGKTPGPGPAPGSQHPQIRPQLPQVKTSQPSGPGFNFAKRPAPGSRFHASGNAPAPAGKKPKPGRAPGSQHPKIRPQLPQVKTFQPYGPGSNFVKRPAPVSRFLALGNAPASKPTSSILAAIKAERPTPATGSGSNSGADPDSPEGSDVTVTQHNAVKTTSGRRDLVDK